MKDLPVIILTNTSHIVRMLEGDNRYHACWVCFCGARSDGDLPYRRARMEAEYHSRNGK